MARCRVIALVMLLKITAPSLHAMCIDPGPPCEAFWKSWVVFVGTVESITQAPTTIGPFGMDIVSFSVEEPFRGVEGQTIEVVSPRHAEATHFEVGRKYFVYADRELSTGRPYDSGCGLTKALEKAAEDLGPRDGQFQDRRRLRFLERCCIGNARPLSARDSKSLSLACPSL